jgi:hypothetical protein
MESSKVPKLKKFKKFKAEINSEEGDQKRKGGSWIARNSIVDPNVSPAAPQR